MIYTLTAEIIKRKLKNKIEKTCIQVHRVSIQIRICPQFMETKRFHRNHRAKYNGMNGHILKILPKHRNKAGLRVYWRMRKIHQILKDQGKKL